VSASSVSVNLISQKGILSVVSGFADEFIRFDVHIFFLFDDYDFENFINILFEAIYQFD
jgi:hypothetical protein